MVQAQSNLDRHAELVSASIPPQGFQPEFGSEVDPAGIVGLNQVDLPLPVPALELLFPQNGAFHIAKHFIADEDVGAGLLFHRSDKPAAKWMLKQVQHDDLGEVCD